MCIRDRHGVVVAQVCAAGSADAALELRRLVGDDIAVEVGEDEHLKVSPTLFIDELGGGDVDIPVVSDDIRILFADLLANLQEFAVGSLDHVGLGDDGNFALVVISSVFIGKSGNALGALGLSLIHI